MDKDLQLLENLYWYLTNTGRDVEIEFGECWECFPYWSKDDNDDLEISGFTVYVPETEIDYTAETQEFMTETERIHGVDLTEFDNVLFSFLHEIGHVETMTLADVVIKVIGENGSYYETDVEKRASAWAINHYKDAENFLKKFEKNA